MKDEHVQQEVQQTAMKSPEPGYRLLTVADVARMLNMTRAQVFNLTRQRAQARMENPIPFLKINGNIRFRPSQLMHWIRHVLAPALDKEAKSKMKRQSNR